MKTNAGAENRVELHDQLFLTGAEISVNRLPAGANVPFVHFHKSNEGDLWDSFWKRVCRN